MAAAAPAKTTPFSLGLFQGVPQHENFPRYKELLDVVEMPASEKPHVFPAGDALTLPESFEFDGRTVKVEDALEETDTAALLVLKDGKIVFEKYFLTGGQDVQWTSWSVAKSFVSALVGIAVAEGHIKSIEDPISAYIDVQPGSAYDGVRIKDVLQMSSGARWLEDYSDQTCDALQLGFCFSGENTFDAFVAGMKKELPPATLCRYNSGDTQALGTLLIKATGKPLAEYMREKLVLPLGFEHSGYWLVDREAREAAFAGLLLTARDFAKLGELYRLGGKWHSGAQIVPAEWVSASSHGDAPHLAPGTPVIGDGIRLPYGYGYQWWLMPGPGGQFAAQGVYNQTVQVAPEEGVVVVKLSATKLYGTTMGEETNKGALNGALLGAIVAAAGKAK
ncbi:beta-lactamase/transpeptidase-like protein [Hyaloraphidium curvatum]|nr:beta-lactamase/transpeptidase-like protein [Hyaloraphidium curvatum]